MNKEQEAKIENEAKIQIQNKDEEEDISKILKFESLK